MSTFGEVGNEHSVMVRWFLLSKTDEHRVAHVSTDVGQQVDAGVDLSLKEAEQRVLYVLHGTLQCRQRLQTNYQQILNYSSHRLIFYNNI